VFSFSNNTRTKIIRHSYGRTKTNVTTSGSPFSIAETAFASAVFLPLLLPAAIGIMLTMFNELSMLIKYKNGNN